MYNDAMGICQRRDMAATDMQPSLWDAKRDGADTVEDMLFRHRKARVYCHQCPLLDACEAMLSEHEKLGIAISGVVAGRYSDVSQGAVTQGADPRQRTCRGCHEPMQPQHVAPRRRKKPLHVRIHVCEGLCDECYPRFSRAARNMVGAA